MCIAALIWVVGEARYTTILPVFVMCMRDREYNKTWSLPLDYSDHSMLHSTIVVHTTICNKPHNITVNTTTYIIPQNTLKSIHHQSHDYCKFQWAIVGTLVPSYSIVFALVKLQRHKVAWFLNWVSIPDWFHLFNHHGIYIQHIAISDKSKEDYTIWSLYLVFLGVTLPDLAFKPDSTFLPFFEGHENNAHCLAIAVNALAGAIFAYYGEQHQRERMKEFLVVRIFLPWKMLVMWPLTVHEFQNHDTSQRNRERKRCTQGQGSHLSFAGLGRWWILCNINVTHQTFVSSLFKNHHFWHMISWNHVFHMPCWEMHTTQYTGSQQWVLQCDCYLCYSWYNIFVQATGRKQRDTETPFWSRWTLKLYETKC